MNPNVDQALAAVGELRARLRTLEQCDREPIAVVGIGCRFPGQANNPESYWDLLKSGRDAITEIPWSRWSVDEWYSEDGSTPGKANTRWGGFIDKPFDFDAGFFQLTPREASAIDPQQRVLLEVTWEALADAGLPIPSLARRPVGVYVGIYNDDYRLETMSAPEAINSYSGTGTIGALAANRISYLLDARGPSLAVNTTCSSSLVAVHLACQALRTGDCDLAIVAGVNLMLSPLHTVSVSKVVTMAADGRCKAFDASADGIVRSEGCGVVILKPLHKAMADGDRIYAVVMGTAVNQDGRSNGMTAPNAQAQEEVIRAALRKSGLHPEQITYVETHGTGTPLGDPIECEALGKVFAHHYYAASVKTNLGHLEAAAGIAGFIKTALALHHGNIPPHLHLKERNPHLPETASWMTCPTENISWPLSDVPRSAGVSAFSLGGTNAHVVLQEQRKIDSDPAIVNVSQDLLFLSARSETALKQRCIQLENLLNSTRQQEFRSICYTSRARSTHYEHRLALLADNGDEAANRLRDWIGGIATTFVWSGVSTDKPLAFVIEGGKEESLAQKLQEAGVEPDGQVKWTSSAAGEMLSAGYRRFVALHGIGTIIEQEAAQRNIKVEVIPHSTPLQEMLARLYAGGSEIHWPQSNDGQVVSLPTYPWRRQTYTLTQMMPVNSIAGSRLTSAIPTFEKVWSRSDIEAYTHDVSGQPVIRLSTLLAKTAELAYPNDGFSMEQVVLPKLLDLSPGDKTQLVLDESERGIKFRWFRWRDTASGWQVHASGLIRRGRPNTGCNSEAVDSLLQKLIETAATAMPTDRRWIPFSIESLVLDSVPALDVLNIDIGVSDQRSVDVTVRGPAGIVCVSMRGLSLLEDTRHHLDLYQVKWQEAADLEPAVVYERAAADLNALCSGYCAAAIRKLQGKVTDKKRERLYQRIQSFADEGGRFQNYSELQQKYPTIADELQLLERCGNALAEIVSGEINPSTLLFKDETAERVYRDSPFARHYHPLAVNAIESRIKPGRRARILEVGAGTGGLTTTILKALSNYIDEYVFTDISPTFLRRARERFSEYSQLKFERLDLDRDLASQGFANRQFDFVIASNSLHVAANVQQTLTALRSIGSCLILVEGTGNRRWADLTFGLTQGWGDRSSGPLFAPSEWASLLTSAGWPHPVTIEGPGEQASVMIAGSSRPWWGVVADSSIPEQLVDGFERFGHTTVLLQREIDLKREITLRGPAQGVLFCAGGQVDSLLQWVRAVASNNTKLFIATRGAQSVAEPVTSPEQAAAWGFAQVLQREHPDLFGGIVDADDRAIASGGVVRWLLQPESRAVALRGSTIYRACVERVSSHTSGKLTFATDRAYLVTGGLGGVGQHVAEWLAARGAKHIVLASRKGPNHPRSTELLTRLTQLGCKAVAISLDVSSRANVKSLIERFGKDLPPLHGIFHTAGAIRDRTILQLTPEDLAIALEAKAHGARLLHEYSRQHQPEYFVLFSSAVTLFSMAGLSGYTAANAYLDALALHRHGLGLPATSISWGGWKQIGMHAAVGERRNHEWERMGLFAASPEQCLNALEQALTARVAHAVAVDVDWQVATPGFAQPPQSSLALSVAPVKSSSRTTKHSRAFIHDVTTRHLRTLLTDLNAEPIDSNTSLIDLGLDSVSAVELRNLLVTDLHLRLPATLIFDHPSLSALVSYLFELSGEQPSDEMYRRLLGDVERMSASESEQLLAALAQSNE